MVIGFHTVLSILPYPPITNTLDSPRVTAAFGMASSLDGQRHSAACGCRLRGALQAGGHIFQTFRCVGCENRSSCNTASFLIDVIAMTGAHHRQKEVTIREPN